MLAKHQGPASQSCHRLAASIGYSERATTTNREREHRSVAGRLPIVESPTDPRWRCECSASRLCQIGQENSASDYAPTDPIAMPL